jgi:hypothetical protein
MQIIPQTQKGLPKVLDWNRKIIAKMIPPRFPLLPTMPL